MGQPFDGSKAVGPQGDNRLVEWPAHLEDFELDQSHAHHVHAALVEKIARWSDGQDGPDFDTDDDEVGERSVHEDDGSELEDRACSRCIYWLELTRTPASS